MHDLTFIGAGARVSSSALQLVLRDSLARRVSSHSLTLTAMAAASAGTPALSHGAAAVAAAGALAPDVRPASHVQSGPHHVSPQRG